MISRLRLFILLIVTAFSTGNLQAQEPIPGCPQDLETLTNWWVTTPDMGAVVEVTAWLTFTNNYEGSIEFNPDPAETMQIWSIPDVMEPESIVFNSAPSGTTGPGENYAYDITMSVANLPMAQTGLAFRPMSITLGTMGPNQAGLVSAAFSCVAGDRGQSPIPALSAWSRIALLLVLMAAAILVFRRRVS